MGAPPPEAVHRAAQVIASADLPVWLVGARGARSDVIPATHELLGKFPMPIIGTFQGAGAASGSPTEDLFVGRVGLFRNQPGDQVLAQADVVITVGYDPIEYEPRFWNLGRPKKIIHLDALPADWDSSYQPEVELCGGPGATVAALSAALPTQQLPDDVAAVIAAHRPALGAELDYDLALNLLPTASA